MFAEPGVAIQARSDIGALFRTADGVQLVESN
jgi:hypothetical protein